MAARQCIFCTKRADSDEHLFPDWINETFDRPSEPFTVSRTVGAETTYYDATLLAHLRVRDVVCQTCNSGWMSDHEAALKPVLTGMIQGSEAQLSPADQIDLSAWASLKAYILEAKGLGSGRGPIGTRADHSILRDEWRPPASVRVFLAANAANVFGVGRYCVSGEWKPGVHGAACSITFLFGIFNIQVVLADWDNRGPFESPGVSRGHVATLTPPISPHLAWPPPTRLDLTAIAGWICENLPIDRPIDGPAWPPPPPPSDAV